MRQFHAKAQRRKGSFWKIGLICVAMVLLAGPSGLMQQFSTPVVSLRHYEIKPDSLPPPNLGPDADNPPRGVPKPADAALHLPRILRRTKQKGTALLRCPPASLVWLPQHSRRPAVIRPATCPTKRQAMCPTRFRGKQRESEDGR